MGLDSIFTLTQARSYELRIDLTTFQGAKYVANYNDFKLTENVSTKNSWSYG
jgi:hypothetical protein